MKKLWIFGDSFADPKFGDTDMYQYKRWWEYLEETHEIMNFAETGTGPRYQLSKLYKMLNEADTSDVDLLFLSSDIHRIEILGIPPTYSHSLRKNMDLSIVPKPLKRAIKGVRHNFDWMMRRYCTTDSWILEQWMIYNSLYALREKFNNVFVWQVFSHPSTPKTMIPGFKQNYDVLSADSNNWHLETCPMAMISFENCNIVTKAVINGKTVDPRLNHFGENVSRRIGEELVRYFDSGEFDLDNITVHRNKFNYHGWWFK